jgi:hypothetical protein
MNDLLLRSAEAIAASTDLDELATRDAKALYGILGACTVALAVQPAESDNVLRDPDLATRSPDSNLRAIDAADLQTLGARVFLRWSRALHELLCGSSDEDKDLRDRLWSAITGKTGGITALFSAVLVSSFGATPAVAAIVATLIAKVVLQPAGEELCSYWAKQLDIEK